MFSLGESDGARALSVHTSIRQTQRAARDRWRLRCLTVFACFLATAVMTAGAHAQAIPPGTDCLETTAGSTWVEFGGGSQLPPIPANFFFSGSQPFEGTVDLRGDPLPGYVGAVNTLVERKEEANMPGPATVEVELKELHLVSVMPIMILDDQAPPGEYEYDVTIELNPTAPSIGFMTITETATGVGGEFTFDAGSGGGIYVYARFNFFEAWPNKADEPIIWDPPDPLLLESVNPQPWQYEMPDLACYPNQDFYPVPGEPVETVLDGGASGEHDVIPPRQTQACCLPDGVCIDIDPVDCIALGGVPQGPDTGCVDMTIPCCIDDGTGAITCVDVDPICCDDLGGTQGWADHCLGDSNGNDIDDACEDFPQACCLEDGTCVFEDPFYCIEELHGVPQGMGTLCTQLQACCLEDGICVDVDPLCCDELGGTPQGAGTACVDMTIACCLPDDTCVDVDPLCCDDIGGESMGPGTSCETTLCWCDWVPGDEAKSWVQMPDVTPNGVDVRVDSYEVLPRIMAASFGCTSYGPITDVHLWGSWFDDAKGQITSIRLSIWSNNPTGPGGYYVPDEQLWDRDFLPGEFSEKLYAEVDPGERWWDPATGQLIEFGDTQVWQINICIDPSEAFYQEGTPAAQVIYWLGVEVMTDGGGLFGWKSYERSQRGRDIIAAVWAEGEWPPDWEELRYPLGHPYAEDRMDLALVITGDLPEKHSKWLQPPQGGEESFDAPSDLWWHEGLSKVRIKWEQAPIFEDPCYYGWDEESAYWVAPGQIVADDWYCADDWPVSDVHWWGSYLFWDGYGIPEDAPESFHIGIWEDVPAGGTEPFSHPGEMIWEYWVDRSDLGEVIDGCDEYPPYNLWDQCFTYDLTLPDEAWFEQQPGPHIYWLSIAAHYPEGPPCACNGDVDENGVLNAIDSAYVSANVGCSVGTGDRICDRCDINCDGVVDNTDEIIVDCQINMGTWPPDKDCCIGSCPYGVGYPWGWKTRQRAPGSPAPDAAVRIYDPTEPTVGSTYALGEPIENAEGAWDMAFRLTSVRPDVNKVVADDFISDGRPIESLRWWGSYLDPLYEPDCGFEQEQWTGDEDICEGIGEYVLAQSFRPQEDFDLCMVSVLLEDVSSEDVTLYVQDGPDETATVFTQATVLTEGMGGREWYEFAVPDYSLLVDQAYFIRVAGTDNLWCRDVSVEDLYGRGAAYRDGEQINEGISFTDFLFVTYSYASGVEPYVLDGWFISIHHAEPDAPCPPEPVPAEVPTVLGVYFAPVDAVTILGLDMGDCFGHGVYEYVVDLWQCCLLCSEEDPRTPGSWPAGPYAFWEEAGFNYWVDIQAVVGVTWQPPACDYESRVLTGHMPSDETADGHFWGWHTSLEAIPAPCDLMEEACTGEIIDFTPYPPDCWDYGNWVKQPWLCEGMPPFPPVHTAFELLTSEEGCPCLGDMNGDGVVNGLDIQGFVDCVLGHPTSADVNCACADFDCSKTPDIGDIPGFVDELLNTTVCT